jgi:hypothetical protein
MRLVRLCGGPTVAVWSKGMYNSRAKTATGAEDSPGNLFRGVCCSREIAAGFLGIFGSRAKVGICCVMLVYSRKIVHRYVMMNVGWRENHYGLFFILK